jgi:aminoglycoside 3-N-acetyltransferase
MATFTYQCDLGTSEPTAPPLLSQRYRPDLPCSREMGAVAEAFRCRMGTCRIHHPGLSLAVWGNDAEGFAARHRLFDSFSASSPLGKLYLDGKVVMIGTDFETITLLHLAEYVAAVPYQGYSHYFGTSDENKPVVQLRTIGASTAFTKFTGLLNTGVLRGRTVAIGNSHITVIHARELVDFAAQMLRYLPDFVLGTETTSCRERRQLLASVWDNSQSA